MDVRDFIIVIGGALLIMFFFMVLYLMGVINSVVYASPVEVFFLAFYIMYMRLKTQGEKKK